MKKPQYLSERSEKGAVQVMILSNEVRNVSSPK